MRQFHNPPLNIKILVYWWYLVKKIKHIYIDKQEKLGKIIFYCDYSNLMCLSKIGCYCCRRMVDNKVDLDTLNSAGARGGTNECTKKIPFLYYQNLLYA